MLPNTSFVMSLEPKAGACLDVYPTNVQARILALAPNQCVYIGADCFGATISSNADGLLHQRTPPVGDKPPGTRTVMRMVDKSLQWVDVVKVENLGWMFETHLPLLRGHVLERKRLDVASALRHPPQTFMWQWSTQMELRKAREKDWLAYNPTHSAEIERCFQTNEAECSVTVGIRRYHVIFLLQEDGNRLPYARQVDRQRNRARWVRRAACHLRVTSPPESETSCALCCEEFADTSAWPWTTTTCGHVFHAVCLLPIVNGPHATHKCPMCRAALHNA